MLFVSYLVALITTDKIKKKKTFKYLGKQNSQNKYYILFTDLSILNAVFVFLDWLGSKFYWCCQNYVKVTNWIMYFPIWVIILCRSFDVFPMSPLFLVLAI